MGENESTGINDAELQKIKTVLNQPIKIDGVGEFIDSVRLLREKYPNDIRGIIESDVTEEYKKKFLLEMVDIYENSEADKAATHESMKNMEIPEPSKSNRNFSKWALRIYLGLLVTSGVVIAYDQYEHKKDKELVQGWEKQKLVLTPGEIEQQADTLFQGLQGRNWVMEEAYSDLQDHLDTVFADERRKFEDSARSQIIGSIQSLEQTNPQKFNDFVFEYWKSKNNLPNHFAEISKEFNDIEEAFKPHLEYFNQENDNLKNKKNALFAKLEKSYEKESGKEKKNITWHEAQAEVQKTPEQKKIEIIPEQKNEGDTTGNAEYAAFKAHIDSIPELQRAYQEYLDSISGTLSHEVQKIQDSLNRANAVRDAQEAEVRNQIKKEKDAQIILVQAAYSAGEINHIEEQKNAFTPEVWNYLKNYYLSQEVFGFYDGVSNPEIQKELRQSPDSTLIKNTLSQVSAGKDQFDQATKLKIEEINQVFADKEGREISLIIQKASEISDPIEEVLKVKTKEYEDMIQSKRDMFQVRYKDTWNAEIERMHSHVKPM